jgi:hypothetical protein
MQLQKIEFLSRGNWQSNRLPNYSAGPLYVHDSRRNLSGSLEKPLYTIAQQKQERFLR